MWTLIGPRVSDLTLITTLIFLPSRELEAEIYHLGQRLEELQDHMDQTQGETELCRPDLQNTTQTMSFLPQPAHLSMPSGPISLPEAQTCQEVLLRSISLVQSPFASSIHSMLIPSLYI